MTAMRMPPRVCHHRSGSKLEWRAGCTVTRIEVPFIARSSTRWTRREWSLAATNTIDWIPCVAHHERRISASRSVPMSTPGICSMSVTPSEPQLANLPCAAILVRKSAANKLMVFAAWRIHKDGHSLRYAAMHEVRCFDSPGAGRIQRYDDNIGRRDRVLGNERPTRCSQDWLLEITDGENRNRGDCDEHEEHGPTRVAPWLHASS